MTESTKRKAKIGITLSTKDAELNLPSERINVDSKLTPAQLKELLKLDNRDDVYFVLLQPKGAVHLKTSLEDVCKTRNVEIAVCTAPQPLARCEAPVSCIRATSGLGGNLALVGLYTTPDMGGNNLQLWNLEDSVKVTSASDMAAVRCMDVVHRDEKTGDAIFAIGSNSTNVTLWNWSRKSAKLDCCVECIGHDFHIGSVATSPNHQLLASTGLADGTVKVWSASLDNTELLEETGGIGHRRRHPDRNVSRRPPRLTYKLPQGSDGFQFSAKCANWLDDSNICAVSQDRWIRVYDIENGDGEPTSKLQLHADHAVSAIATETNSGSQLLAAGLEANSGPVMIVDFRAAQQLVHQLPRAAHHAMSLRWNPSKAELLTEAGRDAVNVWDIRQTAQPVIHLPDDRPPEETGIVAVDWASENSVVSSRQEEVRLKKLNFET